MRLLERVLAGALVAGAAAVATTAAALGAPGVDELRLQDTEVSADGRVSVVVAGLDLPPDADPSDLFEVGVDGEERPVDVTPVEPGDVEVALVVDNSDDQLISEFRELQNVAMELALRLPAEVRTHLVTMAQPPTVAAAASTDVLERAAAVGGLEPGGSRALYDALALATEQVSDAPGGRRRVVVIGAGQDEASSAGPGDVREELTRASAVYVIDRAGEDSDLLDELVATSGGLTVPIDGTRGAHEAAGLALTDLAEQYELAFAARPGATVHIRFAGETGDAETSLTVPSKGTRDGAEATPAPPAEAEDDTEVLAAPREAVFETVEGAGWVVLIGAVAAATILITGMAVLVVTRRREARQQAVASGAVTAAPIGPVAGTGGVGRVGAPGIERALPGALQRMQAAVSAATARSRTAALAVARASGSSVSAALEQTRRAGSSVTAALERASRTGSSRPDIRRPRSSLAAAAAGATSRIATAVRHPHALRNRVAAEWRATATQVRSEVGGDELALHNAAVRIAAARSVTADDLSAAGADWRLAVSALSALPVVAGAAAGALIPGYLERVTASPLGWLTLAAAMALTVTGALWLRRVAKPPFTWSPDRWRAHARRAADEQRLADGLDRAWLYAVAGLDLEEALRRAVPDRQHPAAALLETLDAARTGGPVLAPVTFARSDADSWLTVALRWRAEGMPAADVLAAARVRLQADGATGACHEARRIPASALVPLLVCIAPATFLVGSAAWL